MSFVVMQIRRDGTSHIASLQLMDIVMALQSKRTVAAIYRDSVFVVVPATRSIRRQLDPLPVMSSVMATKIGDELLVKSQDGSLEWSKSTPPAVEKFAAQLGKKCGKTFAASFLKKLKFWPWT
jgi:hypothetical protein